MRYLMTHSLLGAWLYSMKDNPYEDAENEKDSMAEFLTVLRREPTEPNMAMIKGRHFEDLITAIIEDRADPEDQWYDAAKKIADRIDGGLLQYAAKREIVVDGITFLLYGRLDALKAGEITDIKYSGKYERGKFFESTQHPVYMELIPEAERFTYRISNGRDVWEESYRRDETRDIRPIISDFIRWLKMQELFGIYCEHWQAK